jgi:hypothetical protein
MGFWKGAGRRPLIQDSERMLTTTVASSAATISNRGVYYLASTSTGGMITCTINPPAVGERIAIACNSVGSTSSWFYVNATSSGYTFDGTNDRMTFGAGDAVTMVGYSSARYHVLATNTVTTMAFSTST